MAQAPIPPAPPPRARTPVAVIVVAVLFACTFIAGLLAAIAIPSFVRYMRRAKAAEAQTNIQAIVTGIEARWSESRTLPSSIPPTPATPTPGCPAVAWPVDASPAWEQISFVPFGPLRYAYSIDADPDGGGVWVRAVGDLDCDGILGRFQRRIEVAPGGQLAVGPLIRTDELE